MINTNKFWIAVISKDHAMRAVDGNFIQLSHGKETLVKRLHKGDWLLIYSSKNSINSNEKCQSFTAVGQVSDDKIYRVEISENFKPYRRNMIFFPCNHVSILPLINELAFIQNKKSWGYPFRFGFFEIYKNDFLLIAKGMMDVSMI